MKQVDVSLELAKSLARDVEYSAEVARQVGFHIPAEYDFKLAIERVFDDGVLGLRMGINEAMFVRNWDPKDAEDLARIGAEVVSRYIDATPACVPELQVNEVELRLARLSEDKVASAAAKAARNGKYEVR